MDQYDSTDLMSTLQNQGTGSIIDQTNKQRNSKNQYTGKSEQNDSRKKFVDAALNIESSMGSKM